jgi:hypothetical protein
MHIILSLGILEVYDFPYYGFGEVLHALCRNARQIRKSSGIETGDEVHNV